MAANNVLQFHRTTTPTPEKCTVEVKPAPPVSRKGKTNEALRSREWLVPSEVDAIKKAAKGNRNGHRDVTMIEMAYRHGLRVSELVDLRWDQVDWATGQMVVNRLKNGAKSVHHLLGTEIRALRRLKRESPESPFMFVSERLGPFKANSFRMMLDRAAKEAGIPFKVHPHMLRHGCGYKLANDGKDTRSIQHYMGHKNIQNTMHYTALSADRFRGFWKD